MVSETAQLIDSEAAATAIGITRENLYMWLSRHPEYRPAQSFGGVYLWTEAEIQRVVVARGVRKGGNRSNG